jgi:MFS family permease
MATPDQQTQSTGMAWWVWCLAVAFVVFLFSFQTGYGIVSGKVQESIGLTVVQVSTIAAVYTWAFAIFQFFGGALLDRLGSRKILPISIALVVLGVFVFANAQSYGMLLLSQVILAIGSCTGFVGAGYIGGQWFGMAKFSFMFGLVQMIAALTSAISQNVFEYGLGQMDWRTLFNVFGAIGIGLLALGIIYIRNPAPVAPQANPSGDGFFVSVIKSMAVVAKIPHVWVAAISGAFMFGSMLSLGVVWMPKLMSVHGLSPTLSTLGASMLWLGLAVGSPVITKWSDQVRRRKQPIVIGAAVQLACLVALLFLPGLSTVMLMGLCFLFGFANAAHMLSFSTAADVVKPQQIGTSAAIVNGIMFILGGVLISRPGVRIGMGMDKGIDAGSMALAQYAALPLLVALSLALLMVLFMKETYPSDH